MEDSERLRRTLGRCAEERRLLPTRPPTGRKGWLAQSNAYGVIILDMILPALDGLTVLSRLREAPRWPTELSRVESFHIT